MHSLRGRGFWGFGADRQNEKAVEGGWAPRRAQGEMRDALWGELLVQKECSMSRIEKVHSYTVNTAA